MKYNVLWTDSAAGDLDEIIGFMITNNDLNNARRIYGKIKEKAELLKVSPEQGRLLPELEFIKNNRYREIIISPWRIIYRIENKEIIVLMIIDGRRNLEDILFDRLVDQKNK